MKVLYLTPGVFDKGGISRYNRFQIQALREILGTENVLVLSLLGPKGSENDLEGEFYTDWHGKSQGWPLYIVYSIVAAYQAIRKRPDVIWSGTLNFSALVHILSKLIRSTSVVQVYGYEVWTPRLYRPDIPWGFVRCNQVVSDCHFTAEIVEQSYASHKEVPVIWDCVDVSRFLPGQPSSDVLKKYNLPDPKRHFNVMTLGRLSKTSEYKGYERLIKVFQMLKDNSNLIICGGGDLVEGLKERAKELGISNRIFFPGYIHDDDLPNVYRSAAVFCMVGDRGPGRGEGIPLTPLEAAACGIPILVGNQDGSKEAIVQGVNGYALDPFDLNDIAHHLNRLAEDEPLRLRIGAAARKRIEQEHSYAVFKSHMKEILQKIDENLERHK